MEDWYSVLKWIGEVFVSFAVFVSISAVSAVAQVHIRENVVISPEQPKKVLSGGTNNHTIRFEFDWGGSPKGRVDYYSIFDCGFPCPVMSSNQETGSSYTVTIDSPPAQ